MSKGRRGGGTDAREFGSAVCPAKMGKVQIGAGENGWRLFAGVLLTPQCQKGGSFANGRLLFYFVFRNVEC